MEDLKRQVAAAQDTANKARAEAAEAKAEAVKARNEAGEAKAEAAQARAEVAEAKSNRSVPTNPSMPSNPSMTAVTSASDAGNIDIAAFKPPFDKIEGGSRKENEAKEDVGIKAFFRDAEKVT